MLLDYILAPLIILLLMTSWIGIQFAWKRFFPEEVTDEDVLAMRRKCDGCHFGGDCYSDENVCKKEVLNN